jgi:AMMECR1 domain-containing protein
VNGLKDEIRWTVQSQLPDTVDKAGILARIQQQVLERQKFKAPISYNTKPAPAFSRAETKSTTGQQYIVEGETIEGF